MKKHYIYLALALSLSSTVRANPELPETEEIKSGYPSITPPLTFSQEEYTSLLKGEPLDGTWSNGTLLSSTSFSNQESLDTLKVNEISLVNNQIVRMHWPLRTGENQYDYEQQCTYLVDEEYTFNGKFYHTKGKFTVSAPLDLAYKTNPFNSDPASNY